MAFIGKINQGDTYVPSASALNATADKVNAFPNSGEKALGRFRDGALRIPVYNIGSVVIPAGSAVTLRYDIANTVSGIVPVVKYDGSERPWGVVEDRLTEGSVGSCVVSGAVKIDVSYSGGAVQPYVVPSTSNPSVFSLSSEGTARLLGLGANGKGSLVLLQATAESARVKGAFDVEMEEIEGLQYVHVFNSANPNSLKAGYIYSGSNSWEIDSIKLTAMVGVVYVDVNYAANMRTIAIAASLPTINYFDRRWVYALATVTQDDEVYSVQRMNMPGNLTVTGRWVS